MGYIVYLVVDSYGCIGVAINGYNQWLIVMVMFPYKWGYPIAG